MHETKETYPAKVYFASARRTEDSPRQQDITIPLSHSIVGEKGLEFLAQHPDGEVSVEELPSFAKIPNGYISKDQLTIYQIAFRRTKGNPCPVYVPYDEFIRKKCL